MRIIAAVGRSGSALDPWPKSGHAIYRSSFSTSSIVCLA